MTQRRLRNWGVRPGDRVMIVGENCREFVAILLASAGMDAWPVLVNANLSAREIDEIREHCGLAVCSTPPAFRLTLPNTQAGTEQKSNRLRV